MKVNQKELEKAVLICNQAVLTKTTIDVLASIKFEIIGEAELLLSANNNEISICKKIPLIESGNEKPFCLKAALLSKIISSIPSGEVEIIADEKICTIKQEEMKFQLPIINPESFLKIQEVEDGAIITLPTKNLADGIKKTIFAVSEENSQLNGIQMETTAEKIIFTAIDGRRIAIKEFPLEKNYGNNTVLVPAKTMQIIGKTAEDAENANIKINKTNIMFTFGETKIVSRLIAGKIPNLKSVTNAKINTTITIDKGVILESLSRSMLFVSENGNTPLIFEISPSVIKLNLQSEKGKFNDTLFAGTSGEDLKIGFSPKLLQEIIRVIDEEELEIGLSGKSSPAIIKKDDDWMYVVLPINIL